jgi:8-oxo-dGTP diphosphatase
MVVVAAVIVRDGRVLACQRSRKGRFPLKWEFPGGKVQPGEMPEAALRRELNEELGVQAKIGAEILRTQHKYEQMREPVELIFFEASVERCEMENRVFEKIDWVEPERLREMDFLEADRELIEKLAGREIRIV